MATKKKGTFSSYSLDEEYTPRPLSSKNRIVGKNASDVKAAVAEIVAGHMVDFEIDMSLIKDPKERCDIMLKLMQFVLPKVSAVDVNGAIEVDSVRDELAQLSQQTVIKTAVATSTDKNLSS